MKPLRVAKTPSLARQLAEDFVAACDREGVDDMAILLIRLEDAFANALELWEEDEDKIREKLRSEVIREVKDDIRDDTVDELRDELRSEILKEIKDELQDKIIAYLDGL